MTDVAPPKTPYVGLVPYDEEDADLFFGRDEEKRIVAANLRATRLTIVYGPSGVGKTSLLQAGVVHDLRRQILAEGAARPARSRFGICVFRAWRDDPLPALMAAIGAAAAESRGRDIVRPWRPGTPPVATLRAWTKRVRTLLVVLDQFEEYFLYHEDEDGDGTFAGEFPAIVNEPNLRVNFLISIREDAWAKLDRFEGRIPRLFANYVRVEHLSRAAARQAIERPIGEWNRRLPPGEEPYVLEDALVDAVVDAAARTGELVPAEVGEAALRLPGGADAVEAPFLQLVMEKLWRATLQAGARELTLARLEELGGAQQIVENHLLDALGGLTRHEQEVAADLFRFLVTRSKAKIAHPASDLAEWTGRPEAEVSGVLEKLSRGESGRILRPIPPPDESESTRYELFHDVLAEPILEWRRGFEQERARRAALRRFARIGGVLLALVAVFAALGIWALVQRSDAKRAARSATSLALASAAAGQRVTHLDESLLLGLEAYRASPSAEAASSMVGALEAARSSGAETILRGFRDGVRTVAFSPDGHLLAASSLSGAVRVWDLQGRRPLGSPLQGGWGEVWSVAFSPDGRTLAFSGADGAVRLLDVRNRTVLAVLRTQDRVDGVAFSPDGRTLASAGRDGTVRLWNLRDRRPLGPPLRGHTDRVVSVAFSPDGRTLASAGFDQTVRLWDVRTGRALGPPLRGHTGAIVSVAFSPDGRTLASSDLDGTIRLWDVRTRTPRGRPLRGNAGEVWSVAFSADGRTLALSGWNGTVSLRSAHGLGLVGELRGHSGHVDGVAFSPDGRTLASAGFDGTVRLWPMPKPGRARAAAHRPHRSGPERRLRARRAARLRGLRPDGPPVGRRKRQRARRASARLHERGREHGLQPGERRSQPERSCARRRERRPGRVALGCADAPAARPAPARAHRRRRGRRLQPRRAHARLSRCRRDGPALGPAHAQPTRPAARRPRPGGARRRLQPRWAHARLRGLRRNGAALGRAPTEAARSASARRSCRGPERRLQPGRAYAGHRVRGRRGAAVGRATGPAARPALQAWPRQGRERRLQPGRADAGLRRR